MRGAVQKEYHELTPGRSRRAAGGSQTDLFQRVQLYICWQHTARRATPDRSRRTPLIKQLLNVSKCKKFSNGLVVLVVAIVRDLACEVLFGFVGNTQ